MTVFRQTLKAIPGNLRRWIALLVLLSLGAAIAQGFSIGLLLPLLEFVENDAVPEGGRWGVLHSVFDTLAIPINLPSLLLMVLLTVSLAQILIYIQRSQSVLVRERFTAQLRARSFRSFVDADISYLRRTGRGNLVNVLTMEVEQGANAILSLVDMTARFTMAAVYVGLLFVISWQISLAGLGIILGGSLLVQYQIRRAEKLSATLVDLRNRFHNFVVERLEGSALIKLNAKEKDEESDFRELADHLATFTHRRAASRAQIRLIMDPAIIGGGLLVLYLGISVFNVSLVQLAVFLYVLVKLAPEAMGLNQLWHNMAGSVVSLESINQSLSEAVERTTVANGSVPFEGLKHDITLKEVSYAYDHSQPVLKQVNFTVPKGKLTAIMGPSGVGKSTVLDLIVRLADPTEGEILLDGVDLKEFDLSSSRRHIGMVTQDVMLFNETIMANLKYGHADSTEATIQEAARRANAHQFISALPEGYGTVLGHRGLTLSGGERQRLSLARALVGDPSILLLDEVTNNLDAASQQLIQESIREAAKERTVVVSTHDFGLINMADNVIVLEDGRVVEQGTPQELSAGGGLFQHYHEYARAAKS